MHWILLRWGSGRTELRCGCPGVRQAGPVVGGVMGCRDIRVVGRAAQASADPCGSRQAKSVLAAEQWAFHGHNKLNVRSVRPPYAACWPTRGTSALPTDPPRSRRHHCFKAQGVDRSPQAPHKLEVRPPGRAPGAGVSPVHCLECGWNTSSIPNVLRWRVQYTNRRDSSRLPFPALFGQHHAEARPGSGNGSRVLPSPRLGGAPGRATARRPRVEN